MAAEKDNNGYRRGDHVAHNLKFEPPHRIFVPVDFGIQNSADASELIAKLFENLPAVIFPTSKPSERFRRLRRSVRRKERKKAGDDASEPRRFGGSPKKPGNLSDQK